MKVVPRPIPYCCVCNKKIYIPRSYQWWVAKNYRLGYLAQIQHYEHNLHSCQLPPISESTIYASQKYYEFLLLSNVPFLSILSYPLTSFLFVTSMVTHVLFGNFMVLCLTHSRFLTWGSVGSAAVSNAWIERRAIMIFMAGVHLSFKISKQIAPV